MDGLGFFIHAPIYLYKHTHTGANWMQIPVLRQSLKLTCWTREMHSKTDFKSQTGANPNKQKVACTFQEVAMAGGLNMGFPGAMSGYLMLRGRRRRSAGTNTPSPRGSAARRLSQGLPDGPRLNRLSPPVHEGGVFRAGPKDTGKGGNSIIGSCAPRPPNSKVVADLFKLEAATPPWTLLNRWNKSLDYIAEGYLSLNKSAQFALLC